MSVLRVTNQTINDRILLNVQRNQQAAAQSREQLASGLRVNRPSDDPLASAQARLRNADLAEIADAKRSAGNASAWLSSLDTGLDTVTGLLNRARELTTQAANGTYNPEQRAAVALEMKQIIATLKQTMNARAGDAYIFSGTATGSPPYDANGDYQGNDDLVLRSLGVGGSLQVNPTFDAIGGPAPLTARSVLGDGASSGDGRLLDTLETITAHLTNATASDTAALGTSDLAALQKNLDAISNARAAVGGTQNRVDAAVTRMDINTLSVTKVLADTTGADYATVINDLNSQTLAYEASLQSAVRLMQTSLLDFLR